ncbi:tryptophan synthase beta chain 1, chloroplastic isoform X2 [Lactuca sativa]|uniref:tryptophan synthase beta chain 1, chloroplastic isoform X2 n=1 Tax=Lactuca sativa TaxID=4236 RepID=UPI000CD9F328|nr:tryptophan synthase beta chain 1, chloroplastic isoform X2 [Lactuca sativa]
MPLSLSLTAPFRRTTAGSPSGFSNPPLLHSRSLQLSKFRSAKSVSGFRVFAKQNEFPAIRRPDSKGFFGKHGGSHCPDSMLPALSELESAYESLSSDPDFQEFCLDYLGRSFGGRQNPQGGYNGSMY